MAISAVDVLLWKRLRDAGHLPTRPRVLEIGQANWYGDYPLNALVEDVPRYVPADQVDAVLAEVERLAGLSSDDHLFELARLFYRVMLDYESIDAIDLHGPEGCLTLDLNEPMRLPHKYDVVINTGTIEHVFDVAQAFRTIHDATVFSGLMVHVFPFRGWLDHGFWAFNPTTLADVAAANGYSLLDCGYHEAGKRVTWLGGDLVGDIHDLAHRGQLGDDVLFHVAWQKVGDSPFRKPMQGYYAGRLDEARRREWHTMRGERS
jgi:hypothetical protein